MKTYTGMSFRQIEASDFAQTTGKRRPYLLHKVPLFIETSIYQSNVTANNYLLSSGQVLRILYIVKRYDRETGLALPVADLVVPKKL